MAFRQTAQLPVKFVEFDVHRTTDGVLVVHHDATIDRMTDGKGAIGGYSHAELSRFVIIGTGDETIPTLGEVIDIFKPSSVNLRLEIKTRPDASAYEGMEDEIAEMLAESGMVTRSMVTSFSLERLLAFRTALAARGFRPSDLMGFVWLCSPLVFNQVGCASVLAALATSDISEIGLRADTLSKDMLAPFRDAGVTVHGWAAHDADLAHRMFDLGIASFTTDRPDIALAVLAERGL